MSDEKISKRVDTRLFLPFKEEDLRLAREYLNTLSPGEIWTSEGMKRYYDEHASPEFKEHLKRTSKIKDEL